MIKEDWERTKRNILADAEMELIEKPFLRRGQAVFNLSRNWFIEVEKLRATDFDCFYNDNKIDNFLLELENILTKKE